MRLHFPVVWCVKRLSEVRQDCCAVSDLITHQLHNEPPTPVHATHTHTEQKSTKEQKSTDPRKQREREREREREVDDLVRAGDVLSIDTLHTEPLCLQV